MTARTPAVPAGPQVAAESLRHLDIAPEPVRLAVGGQLLRSLDLLPRPATTDCLGCGTSIPAGGTWCSQLCRDFDDRHDAHDYDFEGDF